MSNKPPDEPEDAWSDVIRQVHEAMDAAEIHGEIVREDLLEGVRQALESLEGVFQPIVSGEESVTDVPSVTVVDGGRKDDEPSTEGEPPELRIAEDGVDEGTETSGSEEDEKAPPRNAPFSTTVRVLRTGETMGAARDGSVRTEQGELVLHQYGRLNVAAGANPDQQTIYRGEISRSYRLHCTRGPMRVLLDGQPVETVQAGQSIDVEARLVRVRALDGAELQGRYTRLSDS